MQDSDRRRSAAGASRFVLRLVPGGIPVLVALLTCLVAAWRPTASGVAVARATQASPGDSVAPRGPNALAERIHLVVLHTNDVHGQVLPRPGTWLSREDPPQVGGIVRLAAYVNRVRREAADRGDGVLVVDAGDWYQGTPEGCVDFGLPFVRALSAVGYDALAIGNHEFDHGLDNTRRLVTRGVPHAVCANVVDRATGELVDWVAPYRVVECAGLTIGLVGLVTPATPSISHADTRTKLTFLDTATAFERAERALRAEHADVDLVIPLCHVGVDGDRYLARTHPDLPLIVGGHDHQFLGEGLREGNTLIVQAGARASVVGRVDLWLDSATHAVVESRARLVDLLEEGDPEDRVETVDRIAADLVLQSLERMNAVVGELTGPLDRSRGASTSVAGAWIADALRERMGADIGLMNRGGVRASIPAGPVTRRALFEIAPFDNFVVAVTLSGAELSRLFERAFNGTHSGLDPSGMRFFVKVDADGGVHYAGAEIGGEPIDPARAYRVATNSFLADGGDGYVELQAGREREADPILIRDLLEELFARAGRVVPPADARWVTLPD